MSQENTKKKSNDKKDKDEENLTPEEKKQAVKKEIRDMVIYFLIVFAVSLSN